LFLNCSSWGLYSRVVRKTRGSRRLPDRGLARTLEARPCANGGARRRSRFLAIPQPRAGDEGVHRRDDPAMRTATLGRMRTPGQSRATPSRRAIAANPALGVDRSRRGPLHPARQRPGKHYGYFGAHRSPMRVAFSCLEDAQCVAALVAEIGAVKRVAAGGLSGIIALRFTRRLTTGQFDPKVLFDVDRDELLEHLRKDRLSFHECVVSLWRQMHDAPQIQRA
jgi:hypothetical protein